ncbi:MAG: peroxiredoxin [Bacteroidetes bacterium]|nr:peroxiredoxin [Bacteroidota bacterium]
MSVKPGDSAPDFNLPSSEKEMISLNEQRGHNVVLLFFPAAFTSTCTIELCTVRDDLAYYNNLDARVFGISVDMPYSLAKFKEEQSLTFSLLSDFNKDVIRAYGTIYEDWAFGMKGVAKRSSFVIDKDGIIRHAEVLEDANELPDFEAIKNALEKLGS